MTLKQDLLSVNKEIKALERKMEKLIKEFDKSQKARVAKKPAAKTTKRIPAKKAPVKRRTAKVTATDQVLRLINKRTKKGIDAATIMARTGFNQKKVWAIVLRAYKAGKIKRVGKGLYVGT